jgi:hypothetical protein
MNTDLFPYFGHERDLAISDLEQKRSIYDNDYYEELWLRSGDMKTMAEVFAWYCDPELNKLKNEIFWFISSFSEWLDIHLLREQNILSERIWGFLSEYSGGIHMVCWWWLDNATLTQKQIELFSRVIWYADNIDELNELICAKIEKKRVLNYRAV